MSNVSAVKIIQLGERKFRVDFKTSYRDHYDLDRESEWQTDYHYSSLDEARNRKEELLKFGTEGIEVE